MNPHTDNLEAALNGQAMKTFGLHSQPFCDRPAGHEYFTDPVIQMQLNMLQHNLKFSDMIQVLKGDVGCGKTALVIQMLANANDEFQIFVARGEPSLTAENVITGMLEIFQQPPLPDDIDTCLELLTGYLKIRLNKNLSSVLIVENAHEIGVESLNQLFEHTDKINQTLEGELRILLVADPEFDSVLPDLTSKQLREGRYFISNMRKLDLQRTTDYLEFRLRKAGYVGKTPFSNKQLTDLYKNTAGIPQQLDVLAASMLNQRAGRKSILAHLQNLPLRLLNGAAVVAIVIGLLLFFLIEDTRELPGSAEPSTQVELEPSVFEITPGQTVGTGAVGPESEVGPAAPLSTGSSSPDRPSTIAQLGDGQYPANSVFADSHGITSFEADKSSTQAPDPKLSPAQITEQKTPDVVHKKPSRAESWLLAQSPANYTIQLLAAYDIVELSRYARANKIELQTALFETRRNALRWYVLTYGLYSSAEQARVAVSKLPLALRRNSPWIRSVKSVQQAIGKRQP